VGEGANVRNLYLGHSAWLGLQAARAVRSGIATPQGAIDDFAALALGPVQAGAWLAERDWLILQSYWKPFAAVRHVHYGAQAALRLRADIADPGAIDAIRLGTYPEALHYCGNRAPATPLAAQFSLSFGVAAALVHGDLSPREFRAPCFHDAQLRRLEALVEIVADAQAFPGNSRGARLAIDCGQRTLQLEQGALAGDPGREPSLDAVLAKFHDYTAGDASLARWTQQLLGQAPGAIAQHPAPGEPA
jgi:2-methylcitrate dehydratase PrpD